MKDAGVTTEQLDWLVLHQANQRILDAAAQRLGISSDRVVSNLAEYGNTSAASIPLAFDEAVRGGKIKSGDTVSIIHGSRCHSLPLRCIYMDDVCRLYWSKPRQQHSVMMIVRNSRHHLLIHVSDPEHRLLYGHGLHCRQHAYLCNLPAWAYPWRLHQLMLTLMLFRLVWLALELACHGLELSSIGNSCSASLISATVSITNSRTQMCQCTVASK